MSHHYELHMTRVVAFLGFGGWEHGETWRLFGIAYQGKDIVFFRFIIEYSSLRDFGP
jgi:hypothetical protein